MLALCLPRLIGAPFVIWRTIVVDRQARIAKQSLANDKFNAASEALSARYQASELADDTDGTKTMRTVWKDDLTARLGAIDRFEALVREDRTLAPRVVRILAAYIRSNFPCKDLNPKIKRWDEKRADPPLDLQKAVDAIAWVNEIAADVDPPNGALISRRSTLMEFIFAGVFIAQQIFRVLVLRGGTLTAGILMGHCLKNVFSAVLFTSGKFYRGLLGGLYISSASATGSYRRRGGFWYLALSALDACNLAGADLSGAGFELKKGALERVFGSIDSPKIPGVDFPNLDDFKEYQTALKTKSEGVL